MEWKPCGYSLFRLFWLAEEDAHLNLHNFGFTGGQVSAVGAVLDHLFADSVSRRKEEFGVIIGDFNFMAGDDRVFQVGSPLWVARSLLIIVQGPDRDNGKGTWPRGRKWSNPSPLITISRAIRLTG